MAAAGRPRKMVATKPTPKPKPKTKYDDKYWSNQITLANKKIKDLGLAKYKDKKGTKEFNEYWRLKERVQRSYIAKRDLRGQRPVWSYEQT